MIGLTLIIFGVLIVAIAKLLVILLKKVSFETYILTMLGLIMTITGIFIALAGPKLTQYLSGS